MGLNICMCLWNTTVVINTLSPEVSKCCTLSSNKTQYSTCNEFLQPSISSQKKFKHKTASFVDWNGGGNGHEGRNKHELSGSRLVATY